MVIDINWDEAPEGTTHVIFDGNHIKAYWRKIEKGVVHCHVKGGWDSLQQPSDVWLERHGKNIVERPPKENPLPNGLQWIEGALYYNPSYGGFFLSDERFTTNGGRSWNLIPGTSIKYWLDRPDTIRRYADGQAPQVKVEQPKPVVKKPIGWWS